MMHGKIRTTVMVMLALGCAAAWAQEADLPANQELEPPNTRPVRVNSHQGAFQVMFPVGCSQLRHGYSEPEFGEEVAPEDIVQVTHVSCDRFGEQGAGCWVTSTLGQKGKDGGPAGPGDVLVEVRKVLRGFGAQIVEQKPISKDLGEDGKVEGIDIYARAAEGPGQMWVRGLLYYSDMYVLVAWDEHGGLWENPDYQNFFASFLPFAAEE